MKKVRTILIGTSEFAANIFTKFLGAKPRRHVGAKLPNFKVTAVVTTVDKPVGRKQELTPSSVKKWALEANLPILQPEKIGDSEWIKKIQELAPELIIVCAYGQVIPKEILDIPKHGVLNIHPSLLPKYRGASPIQTAILNNDKKTGVTIMLMDEKMDHGPIVANCKLQIANCITHEELSEKLADLGADLLIKTLLDWIEGKIKAKPQDHSKATFAKIIKKENGKIDWSKSAEEIERIIRALDPWPGTYTGIMNQESRIMNLKILDAESSKKDGNKKIAEVFLIENKELAVQTGNGILILKQVQLEGKKVMPAKDFLNGHPEIVGTMLK